MLLFLFGKPGVGKNYVGELLASQLDYYFWDADLALSKEMKIAINKKESFTQKMRDDLTSIIIDKTQTLIKNYKKVAVAQALFKEKNRNQLASIFPHALFLHIQADREKIKHRLQQRNNSVDLIYSQKIQVNFELPELDHKNILNNGNKEAILQQLKMILA